MSPAMVRTRIDRGQWAKAETGVFRMAGVKPTWESHLLTYVLAAGRDAMASHRSAAALWGLEGFRRTGKPELVLPASRRLRRTEARIHRSSDIHLVRCRLRDGIPVTPVGRTLLDLGAVASRRRTLIAIDDARRRKLVTWHTLLNVLVSHARKGRDGVGTLRAILNEHFDEVVTTDSGLERLVMVLLAEYGLPKPESQHELQLGGRVYRLDLAYVDKKVAIELDGQIHMRRDVWERDLARQNALVNAGWRVLRFTYQQYRTDPPAIVRAVRAALTLET